MSLLNLQKNDILDLTKKDPSLNNIILAGGWDVVKRGLYGRKKYRRNFKGSREYSR